jgi:hypothetical protein
MTITELKKTIGNYKSFGNQQFPLDCDGLTDVQVNNALLSVLGNIGGEKYILAGVTQASGWAGYVFLATQDFPAGELLYVQGANASTGTLVLQKEQVNITASGYNYSAAYTKRTLIHGAGGNQAETFQLADFAPLETNAVLSQKVAQLQEALEAITPPPAGLIAMWSGDPAAIPAGWALCDVGTYSGTTTPDLRGRFIVGYNRDDADYNAIGKVGGEKTHTLSVNEIPSHAHSFKDYYHLEKDSPSWGINVGNNMIGSGDSDNDNNTAAYITHNTDNIGGGQAHENRPPYYVLAYIMKL